MKKLAIIVDGFTGKSKSETMENKDFYFLPLSVWIDGKEYLDGVDKNREELTKILDTAKDVKTSQPSPAKTIDLFTELKKEYENIIYLSVGSAMSGTYQSAVVFARDFENIHVMNNTYSGEAFFRLGKHLLKFIETHSFKETIEEGEKYSMECATYVIPKDLKAIIRSGRLGKAAQIVLQKLNVVPILGYDDAVRLNKKMVKRSGKSAVEWAIDKLKVVAEERWDSDYYFYISGTQDKEILEIAKKLMDEKKIPYHVEFVSGVITANAGNGSIGITIAKKIK